MNERIEKYIQGVTSGLLSPDRQKVERELRNDLRQLTDELRLAGHSEAEAVRRALELFGDPRPVAASMFWIYTGPQVRTIGTVCFSLLAFLAITYSMHVSTALRFEASGCPEKRNQTICLPDRGGWIALEDLQNSAAQAGWSVTPRTVLADDLPGVENQILHIQTKNWSVEIPVSPNRIIQARMKNSTHGFVADPDIQHYAGKTLIRSSFFFETLAVSQNEPVRIKQEEQRSTIQIGETRFEFPYAREDPAGDFLWREVGLALSREFGFTVAAQSKPRGAQFTFSVPVKEQGTYVVIFRHPYAEGVGYMIARSDKDGIVRMQLPIQVKTLTEDPQQAWWHANTVSLLRISGAMKSDHLLFPVDPTSAPK